MLLALSACTPEEPGKDLGGADACGAEGLARLVGQPETVLKTIIFDKQMRILRPGTPATADLQPNRLNITVDQSGTITRVSCG
jgi:hypothetical protein